MADDHAIVREGLISLLREEQMIERMRAAGADAYVLKTAPSEELLAAIRGRPTTTKS